MSELTDKQKRERTEARVGLASNVLGITAGTAALATAAQNPALKKPTLEHAGPVTGKIVRRSGMKGGKAGKLIRAGAIGAGALQAANLGGDIVANRVLSRAAKDGDKVKKSIEQSVISKSEDVYRSSGRGVNIAKAGKYSKKEHDWYEAEAEANIKRNRRVGGIVGGVQGTGVGALGGLLAGSALERRNRPLAYGVAGTSALIGGAGGVLLGRKVNERGTRRIVNDPNTKYQILEMKREMERRQKAVSKANPLSSKKVADLARSARFNFNHASHEELARVRANAAVERHLKSGDAHSAGVARDAVRRHFMNENNLSAQAHDALLNVPAAARKLRNRSLAVGAAGGAATAGGLMATGRKKNKVEKRYYDPEMDRQRRLGMYSGAGIAGGAGLMALGAKDIRLASREVEGGKVVRGLALPKGKKARGKLGLIAGGAAASGAGLVAFKRSNSRQNDPWD